MSSHPQRADAWLWGATVILVALGILMVFSTTAVTSQELHGESTSLVKRHLFHVILGLLVFALLSRLNPSSLYRYAFPLVLFGLFLLVIVLISPLGHSAGGAQRWLALGPLRVQPGELSKILLIIYIASYIERHRLRMTSFVSGILIPSTVLMFFAGLLLLQPDFGSTVVLTVVVFGQLLMASRVFHLVCGAVCGAGACAVLIFTSPYRFQRFVTFLDPFSDPAKSGYQLIQSLIAVGTGGFWGAGLGAGKQKLFYLPAAHTDFIFAVIAEELGLLGALLILALFLIILWRGLVIAQRLAESPFLCTLALGCTLLMVVPALLNIGVVSGLLPTKGLVLPLVAYGGTAMVVHLAAMGILLRLSRMEPGRWQSS